ncbi:glycosyltransferase [Microbacterium phage Luna18]|nr:hypothetical protein SEA_KATCHAN_45 [Microbacterium phage KatChan]URQ04896.1 glycosyltransferase [Microbacterium phage Luna18]
MKKIARSASGHPALGHLHTIGVLDSRTRHKATREEALAELARYRDEGLVRQRYGKEKPVAKKTRAHSTPIFTGQGILFAVIDDREGMGSGRVTTVDVITEAIEAALDAGKETSEEIARYITTSAFQHVPDRRVRFNSVLKASDAVGAQLTRKLYNAYNELEELADEEEDPRKKAEIKAEARGFAEALNVVISPFSCEYPGDPRLVNWEEVDRITDAFIKEQRLVRRERKGNPQ